MWNREQSAIPLKTLRLIILKPVVTLFWISPHTRQKYNHLLLYPISVIVDSVHGSYHWYRCSISEDWFMGFKLWTSDTSTGSILPVGTVRLLFNLPTLIFYLFLAILSLLLSQSISTACHTHKKPLSQKSTCPLQLISYLSLSHTLPMMLEPCL